MWATLLTGWGVMPKWARTVIMYAIVAMGAVGGYAAWSVHKVDQGKAEQRATDVAMFAKQTAKADADRAAAEKYRAQELASLRAYRDANPVGTVRLCLNPLTVSAPAAKDNAGGTAAAVIQSVPAGDSGVRSDEHPDIGGLLEALAARADEVNAQLRADQPK